MWAAVRENCDFCTCGSNNWETVEDRWVHSARRLASTELSFHSCNVLRDGDCHNQNTEEKHRIGIRHTIHSFIHSLKLYKIADKTLLSDVNRKNKTKITLRKEAGSPLFDVGVVNTTGDDCELDSDRRTSFTSYNTCCVDGRVCG